MCPASRIRQEIESVASFTPSEVGTLDDSRRHMKEKERQMFVFRYGQEVAVWAYVLPEGKLNGIMLMISD